MAQITLLDEYGYVILTFVLTIAMLVFKMEMVVAARKKYRVPYPTMYTADDKKKAFNCVQRGHQNTLEILTPVLLCLLIGGLRHPLICSAAGVFWNFGRVLYFLGYSTGDPAKRHWGLISYLGFFVMFGCTVAFALDLLGYL